MVPCPSKVKATDGLTGFAAGVRTCRGRCGAREDRQCAEAHERARAPEQPAIGRGLERALQWLARRTPHQHPGGGEQEHGKREVRHHPAVGELAVDGKAAKDRLGKHAERQQQRQPGEIATIWAAAIGEHPGRERRQRHGGRERTV
jgi:hypothetical protein